MSASPLLAAWRERAVDVKHRLGCPAAARRWRLSIFVEHDGAIGLAAVCLLLSIAAFVNAFVLVANYGGGGSASVWMAYWLSVALCLHTGVVLALQLRLTRWYRRPSEDTVDEVIGELDVLALSTACHEREALREVHSRLVRFEQIADILEQ